MVKIDVSGLTVNVRQEAAKILSRRKNQFIFAGQRYKQIKAKFVQCVSKFGIHWLGKVIYQIKKNCEKVSLVVNVMIVNAIL